VSEWLFLRRKGQGHPVRVRVIRNKRPWLAGLARRMAASGVSKSEIRRVSGLSPQRLEDVLSNSIWGELTATLRKEMGKAA
jgi:hypothetical protein